MSDKETKATKATSSLQRRLLWQVVVWVLLAWLATAVFVWFTAREEVDELLDAHLTQIARLLVIQQDSATVLQHKPHGPARGDGQWMPMHQEGHRHRHFQPHPHGDRDHPHGPPPRPQNLPVDESLYDKPSYARKLHKYSHRIAYQVFKNDQLMLHSPGISHTPISQSREGFETLTNEERGEVWRVFALREEALGVTVYVAEQMQSRYEILEAVLAGFLPPWVLVTPILVFLVWLSIRRGFAPLQRLRQQLQQRDAHALTPITLAEVPSEVSPLLDALNALLLRLDERMQTERRFTADAAHELRTPIAAIRAQAQVALGHLPDKTSQAALALRRTLAGCDRATHLVEQLLTLARIDSHASLPKEHFIVNQVLQEVVAEWVPTALERGQEVALVAHEPLSVQGQAALWHVLLRNLIDNAIRYSPQGARVRVTAQSIVRAAQTLVSIAIEDSGEGLSNEDQQRLGERFFRVLGTQASGTGLGWSIVMRVAKLQNIEVVVDRSEDLGGLRVRLFAPQIP